MTNHQHASTHPAPALAPFYAGTKRQAHASIKDNHVCSQDMCVAPLRVCGSTRNRQESSWDPPSEWEAGPETPPMLWEADPESQRDALNDNSITQQQPEEYDSSALTVSEEGQVEAPQEGASHSSTDFASTSYHPAEFSQLKGMDGAPSVAPTASEQSLGDASVGGAFGASARENGDVDSSGTVGALDLASAGGLNQWSAEKLRKAAKVIRGDYLSL